jgi:ppGpp synthetase/RelA/SpoT-type nucleotidyltranferase
MTLTRSQVERLGVRLVRSDPPAAEDLAALHELLLAYGDVLAEAVARVQSTLGITPSSRVKTTGTILEKLERYGGSWLKSIQDLAGMRIVGSFDRRGQDALVAQLVELFSDGRRPPKVVDRREEPSHGYRAVHVIVFIRALPVEIQVRTELQHEWADLFEKLADRIGRDIRYGEPPDHWLTAAARKALADDDRSVYDLVYRLRGVTIEIARAVSDMIDAYEVSETIDPNDPELHDYRMGIDGALQDLAVKLDEISASADALE